jgi:hypothetical protein
MICSPGSRAYYDQQRARGLGHHAALRQLATGWSASCTAASEPAPHTTKQPHGHIAPNKPPLDNFRLGMSVNLRWDRRKGTIVFAVSIGPLTQVFMKMGRPAA